MKGLSLWTGALAGLLLMIVGGMVPSGILFLKSNLIPKIFSLNSSWQTPALLITSLTCGPQTAVIAGISYLTIGLFYLPIFHGGGSIGYLMTPDFGYLAGLIPAALVSGSMGQRCKKNNLINITISASCGILVIHLSGLLNLVIGTILNRWQFNLIDLVISYSLTRLPSQLIICPWIALISLALKRILFIK